MKIALPLILLFCYFFFSAEAQMELKYDRPVLQLPFFRSTTGRLVRPGCAQFQEFQVNALELYKAQHPSLVDFTYPEAITPPMPISSLRMMNSLPYHIFLDRYKSYLISFSYWVPHLDLDYLWESERKVFGH